MLVKDIAVQGFLGLKEELLAIIEGFCVGGLYSRDKEQQRKKTASMHKSACMCI